MTIELRMEPGTTLTPETIADAIRRELVKVRELESRIPVLIAANNAELERRRAAESFSERQASLIKTLYWILTNIESETAPSGTDSGISTVRRMAADGMAAVEAARRDRG